MSNDPFVPNPLSVQIVPAWDQMVVDLIWKPSLQPNVVGYHVYRASEAPSNFKRITDEPLNTTFFRDLTKLTRCSEKPLRWESPPDSSNGVVAIKARHRPLCKMSLDDCNKPVLAGLKDIQVIQLGESTPFKIERIDPISGLIIFSNRPYLDPKTFDFWATNKPPTVLDELELSYFYVERFTDSTFSKDLYYKVVEVFKDGSEGKLEAYPAISNQDLDAVDVYWREAMRKNRFIFEQVGEPAYVLLRKNTGRLCTCVDTDTMKSRSDCRKCWGVGYEGGYDGPYPITFTPPNSASQVKQGADGRFKTRNVQSFLGPSPKLMSGDLIYRFSGEKLVVLDVDLTSVRGSSLQQTYTTELMRPSDYRHRISITNPSYPLLKTVPQNPLNPIGPVDPFGDVLFPLGPDDNPASIYNMITPGDPIPSEISLQEGVSTQEISDPEIDVTKPQHPEDLRSNTQTSTSPVFENWTF